DEVGALSLRELGGLIVTNRAALDAAEAAWMRLLAEFDQRGGWALDGHGTCVSWLMAKCGLARSTASDRLRVATELVRRPVLAAAFGAGELSYSKVRALTKIVDVDDDADRALVQAARAGTAGDMEKLYRH